MKVSRLCRPRDAPLAVPLHVHAEQLANAASSA